MNLNWTGKTTRFALEHGKLTFLLTLFLVLWGGFSFWLTPKKYNPTIVAPAFRITVEFPGASREEVLEQVTKPLENVLTDIPGVEDIFSLTTRGGRAVVNVHFYVGEDLDAAKVALNDRIQSDMNLAPRGIPAPSIASIDPEDVPIMTLALDAEDWSPVRLRKFAFALRDRLSTVPGTSRIFVHGGQRRELRVLVDQGKMAHFGIDLAHIEAALRRNNLYLPAGVLKGAEAYTPLEAVGWVKDPREAEEIVVMAHAAVDVRLKDVARIEEGPEEVESYVRHVKRGAAPRMHAVLLSAAKLKGRSIAGVSAAVRAKVAELRASGVIPPAVAVETLVDDGVTAKEEIDRLLGNLAAAIAIVTVVLFLFLNFRAALLVAIAIPLTLASVFGAAYLAGQNINRITLFALILSLGLLVDNATVVVENIVRRTAGGGAGRDMFVEAVDEVGPGLFMSTVTTVLAFLPMAFISGMMGPYMGPIPFFVPTALVFSLLISLTINPWLASQLHAAHAPAPAPAPGGRAERLRAAFCRRLGAVVAAPRKRRAVLAGVALALLAALLLPAVQWVKFRMLPKADVDQFFIYLDLPAGASLERTLAAARVVEEHVMSKPEVVMVQSYVGRSPITDFNGLFRGVEQRRGAHQATLRVGLQGDGERERTSEELVASWRAGIRAAAAGAASVQLVEDPPGPPVLSTLWVRVQGWGEDDLRREVRALHPHVRRIAGVVDTDISLPEDSETVQVVVNHFEASKANISPAQIVETLHALYAGKVLGIYHHRENIEQELVRLRLAREARVDAQTLAAIRVHNPQRIAIPLGRLVDVVRVPTQAPLRRENHVATAYISGEMDGRSIAYAALDLLRFLHAYRLADGAGKRTGFDLYGVDYATSDGGALRISLGGEWELTIEVFRDLIVAMLVALVVIYLALVAQFDSFSEPLIVFSTVPLSLIGVLPGFAVLGALRGEYFTATSMIGTIALAGIAVNNAIILLEYLNQLKRRGLPLEEALVKASATRLRPIALTTATTMLGSMTILGDPVWAGLAWAVILGLGVSSALVVVVFPALYAEMRGADWPQGVNS